MDVASDVAEVVGKGTWEEEAYGCDGQDLGIVNMGSYEDAWRKGNVLRIPASAA